MNARDARHSPASTHAAHPSCASLQLDGSGGGGAAPRLPVRGGGGGGVHAPHERAQSRTMKRRFVSQSPDRAQYSQSDDASTHRGVIVSMASSRSSAVMSSEEFSEIAFPTRLTASACAA